MVQEHEQINSLLLFLFLFLLAYLFLFLFLLKRVFLSILSLAHSRLPRGTRAWHGPALSCLQPLSTWFLFSSPTGFLCHLEASVSSAIIALHIPLLLTEIVFHPLCPVNSHSPSSSLMSGWYFVTCVAPDELHLPAFLSLCSCLSWTELLLYLL